MSRRIVFLILTVWALGGCAGHSQKIKGDQVHLFLKDTSRRPVFFASSLDGFQHHPLTRDTKNVWRIILPADQEFRYFYIVDNQPFIPDCPYREKDDFGSENCIFAPDL